MSSEQVQFILRLRKSESTVDDWKLHLKRQPSKVTNLCDFEDATRRAVTKALIGGCIFIYSRSARRISFEINCNDN